MTEKGESFSTHVYKAGQNDLHVLILLKKWKSFYPALYMYQSLQLMCPLPHPSS